MGNGRRRICALLAIAALLCIPGGGLGIEAASFSCSPTAGETVLPGDIVDYTLTIGQSGAADQWTALRVRLSSGMLIDQESITILSLSKPEESAQPETSMPPPTKETPDLSAAPADEDEYEIIPGNDGFVVLFSSLSAGDEISFCAKVDSEQADSAQTDVSAYAQTEGFAVSVSHKLGALPQASILPAEDDTAVQADSQGGGKALKWALVVVCILALGGIGVIAVRKWGGDLKWGGKLKWPPIRLPWQKEKAACAKAVSPVAAPVENTLAGAEPDAEKQTQTSSEALQQSEDSSMRPPTSM